MNSLLVIFIIRSLVCTHLSMLMLGIVSTTSFAQKAVILVRHAEQTPVGGMMDGDPPLNHMGIQRATALTSHLKQTGLAAIYTSQYARARETAEPIASELGIPTQVFPKDDVEGLVQRLKEKHARDIVLVVAHSDTIPMLLRSWGHTQPVEVGKADFGSLWFIVPGQNQQPVVSRLQF